MFFVDEEEVGNQNQFEFGRAGSIARFNHREESEPNLNVEQTINQTTQTEKLVLCDESLQVTPDTTSLVV